MKNDKIFNFNEFLNEGKLYMEEEISFDQDINWEKEIDVSKLWNDYQNGELDLKQFNEQLALKLEENLDNKLNNFKDIIKELKKTEKNSHSIWEKLYDKADENLIKIKI